MTSMYLCLVEELKTVLRNKRIRFRDIFKMVNNKDYNYDDICDYIYNNPSNYREFIKIEYSYNDICKIMYNNDIRSIIHLIETERENIANRIETKFNHLPWLNETLIKCGEQPQPSLTQARKLLKKKVAINIYDLESELFENKTTPLLLKTQLKKNQMLRYPLRIAKSNKLFKEFLVKI